MSIANAAERLGRFPFFGGLSEGVLQQIGGFVEERAYRPGQVVFRQGDPPDYLYLLESGQIVETSPGLDGSSLIRLQAAAGDLLGRSAVLNSRPHQAQATVTQTALVLAISATSFRMLMSRFPQLRQRLQRTDVVNRLRSIPLFSGFSDEQLLQVADLAQVVELGAGQVIFEEGEEPDGFYVIDTGQVQETVRGTVPGQQCWPKYFTAGSFFGRYSLKRGTRRRATAVAATPVRLFRFGTHAFQYLRNIESSFEGALTRLDMLSVLRKATLFSQLSDEELKQLSGYVGLGRFPKDTAVFYQGEIDPTYYLLYEGDAVLRHRDELGRDRPVAYLGPGQSVGEGALFFDAPCEATLQSKTSTSWLYLTRQDLDQFLAHHPQVRDKLMPSGSVTPQLLDKPFDWMDLDEQVLLQRRRHWLALVVRLLGWQTLVLAVLAGVSFWGWAASNAGWLGITSLVAVIVTGLWIVWVLIDWSNDYFVVTSKRILHREKVLLISERRFETPLTKVQNVNIDRRLIGNLLGFGDLLIDTAAAMGVQRLKFSYLSDPYGAKTLIFDQIAIQSNGRAILAKAEVRERLEAGLGTGAQRALPKPAVPVAAAPTRESAGLLKRGYDATLGRMFWITKATEDQVTWRKHWLRLAGRVAAPTALAVSAILVWAFLAADQLAGFIVLLAFLLPVLFWWWWGWQDWGNDLYIVTNDRIIDLEKKPLWIRDQRTEAPFDRVQNISLDIPNPIANLLNYGTVMIFTAGVEGRLDFDFVPKPRQVQAEIFRRLAAYEEARRRQQREGADLPEWFFAYDRTRNP